MTQSATHDEDREKVFTDAAGVKQADFSMDAAEVQLRVFSAGALRARLTMTLDGPRLTLYQERSPTGWLARLARAIFRHRKGKP